LDGAGTAVIDFPAGSTFSVGWDVDHIDALKLQKVAQTKVSVTGHLHSSGLLAGKMTPFDWSSTNGLVQLKLSTGTLTGLPGVVKLLTRLNLHTLFRTFEKNKTPDLPFDLIKTTFTVTHGVFATSSPLVFHSDTLSVWTRGTISVPEKKLDLDVVVQPLTLVDEVLKVIPGIKTILFGHRKTLVPIYVKVTGPFDDPNVDVRSLKTLQKTVWHMFKGIFKLPETMLQDVFGPEKK
jgi:uncharacterized protein YhdP